MPSLVLLHGLFGHLHFPELRHALTGIDVSTPDLIGYGAHRSADVSDLTLNDQASHVIRHIEASYQAPVHLLGHSVGGAVAALVAAQRPELLAGYLCVEGNFTLKDAFWSAQIAQKTEAEVAEIIEGYRADPRAWMNGAVAHPSDLSSRLAVEWLDHQPASTIRAQARAVVDATGKDSYLQALQQTMQSMPVTLICGVLSAEGWDTPAWASQQCRLRINIPGTGHLMMVDNPVAFAAAVKQSISADWS
jgi:pimeloyl-ACP methyl ester carboxylesterase